MHTIKFILFRNEKTEFNIRIFPIVYVYFCINIGIIVYNKFLLRNYCLTWILRYVLRYLSLCNISTMVSCSQSCSVKCQNKDRSRHFGTYLGISGGFPERRLDGFYFPAYSPYIVLHTQESEIYFRGVYLRARSWEETTRVTLPQRHCLPPLSSLLQPFLHVYQLNRVKWRE